MHEIHTAAAKLLGVLKEFERPGQRPHPLPRKQRVGVHVRRFPSYKRLNIDYHPSQTRSPRLPLIACDYDTKRLHNDAILPLDSLLCT
jgi:hypothetical protein